MGAGIAEVFARAGLPVTGIEADPDALRAGQARIVASLDKAVARGKLTQADPAASPRGDRVAELADLIAAALPTWTPR